MEDVKSIVSKNISELRILNNMTQAELAEKLNYSDKTVSKWERGESTPDIAALVEIANIFDVSLDYLVGINVIDEGMVEKKEEEQRYNRRAITYIAEGGVVLAAILAFIITSLVSKTVSFQWLYFVFCVPVTIIIRLVFNSIWFNPRNNYLIVSCLMWSILASIHITFMHFGKDVALVYLLGVAGQVIIILWSFIKKPKAK